VAREAVAELDGQMIEIDVWIRGRVNAAVKPIQVSNADIAKWTDSDVRTLLVEMLLAVEREKNPGGEPPPVSLRGFSWIVSPAEGGVLVHLEMQSGTASAGPFAIDEAKLTDMINRVMTAPPASSLVH